MCESTTPAVERQAAKSDDNHRRFHSRGKAENVRDVEGCFRRGGGEIRSRRGEDGLDENVVEVRQSGVGF